MEKIKTESRFGFTSGASSNGKNRKILVDDDKPLKGFAFSGFGSDFSSGFGGDDRKRKTTERRKKRPFVRPTPAETRLQDDEDEPGFFHRPNGYDPFKDMASE